MTGYLPTHGEVCQRRRFRKQRESVGGLICEQGRGERHSNLGSSLPNAVTNVDGFEPCSGHIVRLHSGLEVQAFEDAFAGFAAVEDVEVHSRYARIDQLAALLYRELDADIELGFGVVLHSFET
jgi:hypothetical protein